VQWDELRSQILEITTAVVGLEVEQEEPLMTAGLDSPGAVELRNELSKRIGIQLPGTLVFDYPTVGAVTGYIESRVAAQAGPSSPSPASGEADLEQKALVRSNVEAIVTAVLGEVVGADVPLMEADMDSTDAVVLCNQLSTLVGTKLPRTLVFDYPCINALVEFIIAQTGTAGHDDSTEEEIGDSDDADHFFRHVAGGGAIFISSALAHSSEGYLAVSLTTPGEVLDGIGAVPVLRWDQHADYVTGKAQGTTPIRFGGFMHDVEMWDPQMFRFSQSEAINTEPSQRLLLSSAYTAFQNDVESLAALKGTLRNVVVGICHSEYAAMLRTVKSALTPYTSLQGALSVACGRISYMFGFNGACLSVDTACSSSLVGTHVATTLLRCGQGSSSLVGGINLTLTAFTYAIFQVSGMLAADGRCKTLDQTGDGYVRAEAAGAFQLRHESDSAGALPLLLLCGSAVNQDGQSSSLTAPNGPAQQGAIRTALEVSQLHVSQYEQLEMHGTGMALGDPIEVGAASSVLLSTPARDALTLWAAKVPHGHAEASAGLIGVLHVVTGITHAYDWAITNLRIVNPYVAEPMSFASTSISAPREDAAVVSGDSDTTRISGISSFAYQGTNSHAILGADVVDLAHTSQADTVWDSQAIWLNARAHPMICEACGSPKTALYQSLSSALSLAYLRQSSANGVAILASTAQMEFCSAAAHNLLSDSLPHRLLTLLDATMAVPLEMEGVAASLSCAIHLKTSQYEILHGANVAHVSGVVSQLRLRSPSPTQAARSSHVAIAQACIADLTVTRQVSNAYAGGFDFGVKKMLASGYSMHPAAMESALQLRCAAQPEASVPTSVTGFVSMKLRCGRKGFAAARPALADAHAAVIDTSICNSDGGAGSASMLGVHGRSILSQPSASNALADSAPAVLYTGEWQAAIPRNTWVPLKVCWLSLNAHEGSQPRAGRAWGSWRHFDGIEHSSQRAVDAAYPDIHVGRMLSVLHAIPLFGVTAFRLHTVGATQEGRKVTPQPKCAAAQSALQGMVRSLASEFPNLSPRIPVPRGPCWPRRPRQTLHSRSDCSRAS